MEKTRFGRLNKYSETVLCVDEAITILQSGADVSGMVIDSTYEIEQFNTFCAQVIEDEITLRGETKDVDVGVYHMECTNRWNFPDEYKSIDVRELLLGRCETQEERDRVEMEYKMYEDRGLVVLLQFFVWLVDHFREHKVLWGVGRGSSVSSLCLYLIGINRVNPLKYDLDIHEFLK